MTMQNKIEKNRLLLRRKYETIYLGKNNYDTNSQDKNHYDHLLRISIVQNSLLW